MKTPYPIGPKTSWLDQADKICSGEIELSSTDIPFLLTWMKDMNWPGASEIAVYLRGHQNLLVNAVADILNGEDEIWAYWILDTFRDSFDADFWKHLKGPLLRLALAWEAEGLHIVSLYILARHGLMPFDEIKQAIQNAKKHPLADEADYIIIEELL